MFIFFLIFSVAIKKSVEKKIFSAVWESIFPVAKCLIKQKIACYQVFAISSAKQ